MPNDQLELEAADLIAILEARLENVHTQSLDLSFNELLDMKEAGELDISPEYQRLFQWSAGAQSRFIESLLLEMPVPPIYVVEETEGRYLLIDGLQRISSYLHLRGKLSAPHLDPPVKEGQSLVLTDCDIVTELNGRSYESLPTALQIRLKRAFVRVEVVRKGSDPRFKYHMFKRLNTGGEILTKQQLRNCTIRLLSPRFNDFIIELSTVEGFVTCTETLTPDRRLGAFDQELVLRFFALKNNREDFKHDVSDFLTEYMEGVSDPDIDKAIFFDYARERELFERTFDVLARTLGVHAFAWAAPNREALVRGFSVYHFEAFTLGIQSRIDVIRPDDAHQMGTLRDLFNAIKRDPEFIRITTGGGKNSPGPLNDRIGFVHERVEGAL